MDTFFYKSGRKNGSENSRWKIRRKVILKEKNKA
jgi:hypothetical protein